MRRFFRFYGGLILMIGVTASLLIVALILRAQDAQTFDRKICGRVDRLATIQIQADQRGLRTIPKISYYRMHPDELQTVIREINIQLRQLRGSTC